MSGCLRFLDVVDREFRVGQLRVFPGADTASDLASTIVRAEVSGLNVGCGQSDEAVHSLLGSGSFFFQLGPVLGVVNGARQLERLVRGNSERPITSNKLDSGKSGLRHTLEPVGLYASSLEYVATGIIPAAVPVDLRGFPLGERGQEGTIRTCTFRPKFPLKYCCFGSLRCSDLEDIGQRRA